MVKLRTFRSSDDSWQTFCVIGRYGKSLHIAMKPLSAFREEVDALDLNESEFLAFLLFLSAHRIVGLLAPEFLPETTAELSVLPGFRHNLN